MSRPFRFQYEELLMRLLRSEDREVNERTGVGIRVGQPTSLTISLTDRRLPMCGIRKTWPKTAAAEVAWFLQGRKEVDFIRKYAPIWDKFVEDDGRTVAGAYGYRWRNQFGRDQIADALQALRANPTDRRIYISAWDPAEDGLGRPSKNVPCPVGFTLSITAGRLNSTLLIRSSDVFVGLPYDVMGHALLMDAIAVSLGAELGTMHVSLAHPHLYECHVDMVKASIAGLTCDRTMPMPSWSVGRIVCRPDAYVEEVAESFKRHVDQTGMYSCRPEVVQ